MGKKISSNTESLKSDYVAYFQDVPVQKYAAMYIGRDEDTIIRWKRGDSAFADAVQRAKATWIRKKVMATKAEFALERLERDVFNRDNIIEKSDTLSIELKLKAFMDDTDDGAYPKSVYA